MSINKRYLNWKTWKFICGPAVVLAFLCLLLNQYHRERVRLVELSNMLEESAALSGEPIKVEISNLEDFQATAYCITGVTKSGVSVASGHVASDPRVIPLGSVIYVESPLVSGIFQVTDTGKNVKGKIIDIFIPSYRQSIEFGRRKIKLKVLRYGYGNDDPSSPHPSSFLSVVREQDPLKNE